MNKEELNNQAQPIAQKTALEDIPDAGQEANNDFKIPRLNKKIIMFAACLFIVCILAGFIFSLFQRKKAPAIDVTKQTNVKIPEFDREIITKQSEENTLAPVIPREEQNPYLMQTDQKEDGNYARRAAYTEDNAKEHSPQVNNNYRENPSVQRLQAEEEAARRAEIAVALNFSNKQHDAEPQSIPAPELSGAGYPGDSVPVTEGNGKSESVYAGYRDANMQEEKSEFYTNNKSQSTLLYAESPAISLSNLVIAGTVIPAVLITAIDSDLPGEILAMVTAHIYSFDGKSVLIPQGTKLIANYNSNVSWQQQRIQIAWNRLIRPDGISIDLGNMPGIDAKGAAGSKGVVDDHPWQIAKGLGILAAFSLLSAEIKFQASSLNSPGLIGIAENTNEQVNALGGKYTERALDIQPTIRIKAGIMIFVFINTDLALPEYYQ